MNVSRNQKIIAAFLLALIAFSLTAPFGVVREAKAVVLVDDIKNNVSSAATAGATTGELSHSFLLDALKALLEALRKRILDMLVDQIIKYIQGNGEARIVEDWGSFLKEAGDAAFGDFLYKQGWEAVCFPFKFQLQVALFPVPKFNQQVKCTLTQVVNNVNNFLADFENGSWIGYTSFLEPQNNYFGTAIIYHDALVQEKADSIAAALNEALAGAGVLGTKSCPEPAICSVYPNESECAGPDIDRDGNNGDISTECITTTPGQTIAAALNQAVTIDIPYIISAQELSQYLSAIIDAVFNKMIIAGVSGLQGISTPNSPSGGVFTGGAGPCAGLTGQLFAACLNYNQAYNGSFSQATSTLISQIDSTLAPRISASTTVASSIQMLQAYGPSLIYWYSQVNNAGPFCDKPTYLGNIVNEQQWASTTLPALVNDQSTNNLTITQLTQFKAQLLALAPNDWANFTSISAQIQASGLVSPVAAEAFKANAESQNSAYLSKITTKLNQTYPGYVTDCNTL